MAGELEQRVVADPRQGGVAGLAMGPQPHPEDPLLADAERVEPAAAELDQHAAALVDDEVAAHLVRVLLAEPVGAEAAADLLVGGDHQHAARRSAGASRCRPARLRPPPRRRPGPSCRARRGRAPSRRRRHPPMGRSSTHRGRPGRCRRGPARSAWDRRSLRGGGRPGWGDRARPRAARIRSRRRSASPCRNSWTGPSLPGGLTVLVRIRRPSRSTADEPRPSGTAVVAVPSSMGSA